MEMAKATAMALAVMPAVRKALAMVAAPEVKAKALALLLAAKVAVMALVKAAKAVIRR